MQILEHPEITRALHTGYPHKERTPTTIDTYCVPNDEFLQILKKRDAEKKKRKSV